MTTDPAAQALREAVAHTVGVRPDLRYPGSVNWWPGWERATHRPATGYTPDHLHEYLPWGMQ